MTIRQFVGADTAAGDLRYQQWQTNNARDDRRRRAAEKVVLAGVAVAMAFGMAAAVWVGAGGSA